jgi:outer membrane scaffolding protein for murein synthesis (MipA/OmpV family)
MPLRSRPRGAAGLARVCLAVGAAAVAVPAAAQDRGLAAPPPLWEFRLGAMALYAPDYPASEEASWRGVGAPLFVYRGERFRVGADDPNAVARAIVAESRRFEFDLSVDAHFGADSDDNDARQGMEDLGTRLEIGPQLTVNLRDTGWSDETGRTRLSFLLPVRQVGATDFSSYDELGFLVQPTLAFRKVWPGDRTQRIVGYVGATWADEGVQDYYFEVAPPDVTAGRPAFDAQEGYLGAHAQITGVREVVQGLNLYLTYRFSEYSGSQNDASPLYTSDTTHATSLSAVWTLARSSRPARNRD